MLNFQFSILNAGGRASILTTVLHGLTLLTVKRGLRRGYVSLLRERTWAGAFTTLLGIVLLGQLFLFLMIGVQGLQHLLRARTDLRLELLTSATDQDAQLFFAAARALPAVERAVYITKEKAYEEERRRDPNLVQFLEKYGLRNPFPDTIGVTLRSLEDVDSFITFTRQPQWKSVIDPSYLTKATDQEREARELLHVTLAIRALVSLLIVLLSVVVLAVTVSLIRSRSAAREEEVTVERLVGADEVSVLLPFAMEAGILLLLSLLLATLLTAVIVNLLPLAVPALAADGAFGGLTREVVHLLRRSWFWILALQILCVPFISVVGAWWGVRKV
ncbi:MAG: hypothetical protein Greene041619_24 [Candidatus Peregrinibacteria bacterium Greene0416_19]|nr:MAG: hypothetical protein Greene041619_24 [Candidatus Peregrinibacteria bacterium Greene0416_19]